MSLGEYPVRLGLHDTVCKVASTRPAARSAGWAGIHLRSCGDAWLETLEAL